MQIKRVVEVWEKGMEGALVGQWPVSETISTAYLYRLFAREQRVADEDMLLSYFLNPAQIAAIQPYVAQEMRAGQYDFILAAYGLVEPPPEAGMPPSE
ncbi:MAG: hypothetical protein JO218_13565 [Burkholderiales bacterium]|nr:hypothetical protein [Burkholderiales bacterium]